jgi:hypothetical protein
MFLLSFISPIGLQGIAILPLWNGPIPIFRDYVSHSKVIPSFTLINILAVVCFMIVVLKAVFAVIKSQGCNSVRVSLGFFLLFGVLFFLLMLGILNSIDSNANRLDGYIMAVKEFVYILIGLRFGYLMYNMSYRKQPLLVIENILYQLSIICLISIFSLALLEPSFKAIRYGFPALLPSQEMQSIALISLALILDGKVKILKRKIIFMSLIIIPFVGAYKFTIMAYLSIIFLYLLLNFFKKLTAEIISYLVLIAFVMVIALPAIIVIMVNTADVAISTRYFQMLNSMIYIYSQGFHKLIFGIGWGQPYDISIPFVYNDQGAWSPEEYESDTKWSIQILPFSLIRSVGLLGFSILFLYMSVKIKRCAYKIIGSKCWYSSLGLLPFVFAAFFVLPDILPETAITASMMLCFFICLSDCKLEMEDKCDDYKKENEILNKA